jgi:hypothetical protein
MRQGEHAVWAVKTVTWGKSEEPLQVSHSHPVSKIAFTYTADKWKRITAHRLGFFQIPLLL